MTYDDYLLGYRDWVKAAREEGFFNVNMSALSPLPTAFALSARRPSMESGERRRNFSESSTSTRTTS
jgi:hypothetical protein